MYNHECILKRHPENPIITPRDFPGAVMICNPGQTMFNGKTLLLLPIKHNSNSYRGKSLSWTAHVALSDDGVNFDIDPEPFFLPSSEEPYATINEQCIDFRITKFDDTYYIVHPGCGPWGTLGILAETKDWKTRRNIDVVSLPDNRIPCLFPEKIGNRYARLDRPYKVCPNEHHMAGNIWMSYSPDLIHWGSHRPLLKPGFSHWSGTKIGPTPPIRTANGWLVIIHGVIQNCSGYRYSIGALLLDMEDPERIVGLTRSAILAPSAPYEFNGVTPNVVFPCGAIADEDKDEIRVYYGCADTYVGLATGSLSELLALCEEEYKL